MTNKQTVDSYNKFAEDYAKHTLNKDESPFHAYYEKPAVQAQVPDINGRKALSIGCGSGEDTDWLQKQGAEATGIDITENLIKIARERYPECRFEVMDMQALQFDDNTFDFAYSSLAIHYVEDWTKALREAYRVLKSGSHYVFSAGHPIDTAMRRFENDGVKEVKMARIHDTNTGRFEVVGDYLASEFDGRRPIDGELHKGMKIRIYHRPISKMIEEIVDSGFIIKRLVEPLPIEEWAEKDSRHYAVLRKIPYFLIWVLEKPLD